MKNRRELEEKRAEAIDDGRAHGNLVKHIEGPILDGHMLMGLDACLKPWASRSRREIMCAQSGAGHGAAPQGPFGRRQDRDAASGHVLGAYFGNVVDPFSILWMFNNVNKA